jgi:MFS family permease
VAVTLAGTDLGIVAASRAMGSTAVLAGVIVVWGAGSLVGGFLFGGLPRGAVGLTPLIAGLAVFTALGALGTTPWLFAILMGLAGLFCAPSIAAISERLGDIVPENSRGEAFGWQGTFNTLGSAMAPPMIGWVMDGHGWQLGLVATGFAGLALATLGWIALRLGRRGIARRRAA